MKKKIIVIALFCLIFSISDMKAIKIGSFEIKHDLAEGYREHSGWFKEKRGNRYHRGPRVPAG